MFFTRVAPAGEFDLLGADFQYGGLILTLLALPAVTMVLRTLLQRKELKREWA